ncbi:MAG: energy transducer TonB [Candidatus Eisenbacteria bacterium]
MTRLRETGNVPGQRAASAEARDVRAARDREDSLFRTLFIGGQIVAGLVFGITVLAGPFESGLSTPDEVQTIQLRFESLPQPEEASTPEIEPPAAPEKTPEVVQRDQPEPKVEPEPDPEPESADFVDVTPEVAPDEAPAPEMPARPVYGVRKVLANGIGRGAASGGIVTRRGNVLNGDVSTAAEDGELVGSLVSISSVDAAPEPVHRVLPEYTDEMRAARASGVVSARLLIDTEGHVREIEILSDFGLGSAELARHAFEQFRFRPAQRGGEPVSVWIVHKIRFEFQG